MGRNKKTSDLLTDFELQIMNIVWKLRSATVTDVIEKLPANKDYAYTTISTMMRLLEQRGILSTVKNGKTHIYVPEISQVDYEGKALNHVVQSLFRDEPTHLVRRLIDSKNLSASELDELRQMIDQKLDGGRYHL